MCLRKREWGSSLKLKLPTVRRHYESSALLINEKAQGFLGIMNVLLREGPGADRERRRQIELLLYWRERKRDEEDEEKEGEVREKHRLLRCSPIFLEKFSGNARFT